MKVRRNHVLAKYRDRLDALYEPQSTRMKSLPNDSAVCRSSNFREFDPTHRSG